jgi:hypothetical protein
MNKYLMLSAAGILAATNANAGTVLYSFQFGTASGGAYCDGGTVYSNGLPVMSWQHTNNDCAGGMSEGVGTATKFPGLKGKYALMSDSIFAQEYGIFSEYISVLLPEKLKKGKGIWETWIGLNGTTAFEANTGPLIEVDAAARKKSGKSVTTGLKELIAVHKAASRAK